MQNALLVGLSRQVALARELDVVANNIANLNTAGFKADGARVRGIHQSGRTLRNFMGADGRISFVQDRATWIDLSQGPLERTGNPLDVAINGKGFLAVQTPRGERYTRNGALQINANGELVTSEGYQVLGDVRTRSPFNRTTATSRSAKTAPSACAKATTPQQSRSAASCAS